MFRSPLCGTKQKPTLHELLTHSKHMFYLREEEREKEFFAVCRLFFGSENMLFFVSRLRVISKTTAQQNTGSGRRVGDLRDVVSTIVQC